MGFVNRIGSALAQQTRPRRAMPAIPPELPPVDEGYEADFEREAQPVARVSSNPPMVPQFGPDGRPAQPTPAGIVPSTPSVAAPAARVSVSPPAPPRLRPEVATTPRPEYHEHGDPNQPKHSRLRDAWEAAKMVGARGGGLSGMLGGFVGGLINPNTGHRVRHQREVADWEPVAKEEIARIKRENEGVQDQQRMDETHFKTLESQRRITTMEQAEKDRQADRVTDNKRLESKDADARTDREATNARNASQDREAAARAHVQTMLAGGGTVDAEIVAGTSQAPVAGRSYDPPASRVGRAGLSDSEERIRKENATKKRTDFEKAKTAYHNFLADYTGHYERELREMEAAAEAGRDHQWIDNDNRPQTAKVTPEMLEQARDRLRRSRAKADRLRQEARMLGYQIPGYEDNDSGGNIPPIQEGAVQPPKGARRVHGRDGYRAPTGAKRTGLL